MATARKITKLASIHWAKTPKTTQSKKRIIKKSKHVVVDSARLLNEGKKLVNNLYKDGNRMLNHASNDVKEYSDNMARKVQKSPWTSVLVATGVGMFLSMLFRRK